MQGCSSPLGWQTSFRKIPVYYHSMPNPHHDALYRCSGLSLPDFQSLHFPRYDSNPTQLCHPGIFGGKPKLKASQL